MGRAAPPGRYGRAERGPPAEAGHDVVVLAHDAHDRSRVRVPSTALLDQLRAAQYPYFDAAAMAISTTPAWARRFPVPPQSAVGYQILPVGMRVSCMVLGSARFRDRAVDNILLVAGCELLVADEARQHFRLAHRHGPSIDRDPSPPLKAAQSGIHALPGGRGLMGELLLGQVRPDEPVGIAGLAEQYLGDAARQVKEYQV